MIWIYTAKISSWPTGSWIIALIGFGIDLICALDTIIVRIWGTVYGSLNYCQIVPFRKHCVFKFVIMLLLDCTSCHWTADHVNSFTLQVVHCASEVYYLHMVHFNQFLLFILCTGLFNCFVPSVLMRYMFSRVLCRQLMRYVFSRMLTLLWYFCYCFAQYFVKGWL